MDLGYSGISTGTSAVPVGTITNAFGSYDCVMISNNSNNSNNDSNNNNDNNNMQVKIAVFEVSRDELGNIISSKFTKEFWVEKINNVSIDLLAAKELGPDFDPNSIVVKEIFTVYL